MKDQETKHTPTPWEAIQWGGKPNKLITFKHDVICEMQGDDSENKKYAAFIVKACNSYENMLEALKQTLSTCKQILSYRESNNRTIGNTFLESAIENAKKAIDKATPPVS